MLTRGLVIDETINFDLRTEFLEFSKQPSNRSLCISVSAYRFETKDNMQLDLIRIEAKVNCCQSLILKA